MVYHSFLPGGSHSLRWVAPAACPLPSQRAIGLHGIRLCVPQSAWVDKQAGEQVVCIAYYAGRQVDKQVGSRMFGTREEMHTDRLLAGELALV